MVSFDRSNNTSAINVKTDVSVLQEKLSFKMLALAFSSKLDWGSYIISINKSASKKIGALVHSINFPSPEVGLYLYKSTIQPCMESLVVIAGFRAGMTELNTGYPENLPFKPRKAS